MKYDYIQIGERIRTERKKYHISQEDMCDKLNIGRNKYSALENGNGGNVSISTLEKICDIFNEKDPLKNYDIGFFLCEYDYSTRENFEIGKHTGLSDDTINKLSDLNIKECTAILHTIDFLLSDNHCKPLPIFTGNYNAIGHDNGLLSLLGAYFTYDETQDNQNVYFGSAAGAVSIEKSVLNSGALLSTITQTIVGYRNELQKNRNKET